jgi:hypothetical protein
MRATIVRSKCRRDMTLFAGKERLAEFAEVKSPGILSEEFEHE